MKSSIDCNQENRQLELEINVGILSLGIMYIMILKKFQLFIS